MNILIIGPSWVGDSVMAQSLYLQLKKEDPDCNIDVVSPPWTVSIMERMPQVSRNIVSPFLHGDIKLISRNRFGKSGNYFRVKLYMSDMIFQNGRSMAAESMNWLHLKNIVNAVRMGDELFTCLLYTSPSPRDRG